MKRLDEMARQIGAGPVRSITVTGDNQVLTMTHEDQVKTHLYTAPFKVSVLRLYHHARPHPQPFLTMTSNPS
jgi:hypothetical protein